MCGLIRNEPGFSKTPFCIIIESALGTASRGKEMFECLQTTGNYGTPTWVRSEAGCHYISLNKGKKTPSKALNMR